MARNTKTYFKSVLASFLVVVVEFITLPNKTLSRGLKWSKTTNKQYLLWILFVGINAKLRVQKRITKTIFRKLYKKINYGNNSSN